eukprot:1504479-Prymnesium_polylepis.1
MALGCKQRLKDKTDFFLLTDLPWAILQGASRTERRKTWENIHREWEARANITQPHFHIHMRSCDMRLP